MDIKYNAFGKNAAREMRSLKSRGYWVVGHVVVLLLAVILSQ